MVVVMLGVMMLPTKSDGRHNIASLRPPYWHVFIFKDVLQEHLVKFPKSPILQNGLNAF